MGTLWNTSKLVCLLLQGLYFNSLNHLEMTVVVIGALFKLSSMLKPYTNIYNLQGILTLLSL